MGREILVLMYFPIAQCLICKIYVDRARRLIIQSHVNQVEDESYCTPLVVTQRRESQSRDTEQESMERRTYCKH